MKNLEKFEKSIVKLSRLSQENLNLRNKIEQLEWQQILKEKKYNNLLQNVENLLCKENPNLHPNIIRIKLKDIILEERKKLLEVKEE